jgi:hypothetical protein
MGGRKLKLGEDHPDTLETINDLGVLRREQKRYEEAESLLRQALEGGQTAQAEPRRSCHAGIHARACRAIHHQARYGEAEPLLLDAFKGRTSKLGSRHPHTIESLNELMRLYESWGKPGKAEEWRAKLPLEEGTKE